MCMLVVKETEGVTSRDTTDSSKDDGTDTGNHATLAPQSSLSRTHEKADMAVVFATYPGEFKLGTNMRMCCVSCNIWLISD